MDLLELPEPDESARAHSEKVRQLINDRIDLAGGAISFAEYMHCALYEPGLGYYMAGTEKFGADGDFITAPEVSSLFGRSLAAQVSEILDAMSADRAGAVLELGAGSGRLALSVMEGLASKSNFSYYILEPSAELQRRQRQLLQQNLPEQAYERVHWLTTLPVDFDGVVIANEVMDALAVERFSIEAGGFQQICVGKHLEQTLRPANDELVKAISILEGDVGQEFPVGYTSEICTVLPAWLSSLATALKRGVLLLIDYGYPRREYYSIERDRGTLACYYRHRAHDDPYYLPGLQDITAHVDFTAVAEAGVSNGLELLGYSSQSAFLLDNGILELATQIRPILANEMEHIALMKQIKTLTLPGEMGERFQVIALGKDYDLALQGFRRQDLSYRL